MSVSPVPAVFIGNTSLATGPAAGEQLFVMDELAVPWGRKSLLEDTKPSTMQLTLLDTSTDARYARRVDRNGQLIRVEWSTGTASGTVFRGRVTDVAVSPRTAAGYVVTLSCSSREVDGANYLAPEGTTWPAETAAQRLQRITALAPGLFAGGVTLPLRADVGLTDVANPALDFPAYPVSSADVSGADLLGLVRGLWRSLYPVPLVYDPATHGLTFAAVARHPYSPVAGSAVTGRLVADAGEAGRYVALPDGASATRLLRLDSADLPMGGPLSQPLEASVTQVEVTYTPAGSTTQATATAATGASETNGRRTLTVESIVSDAGLNAQLAGVWAVMAQRVAGFRLLDPITYTPPLAGFPDDATALALLATREQATEVFLGRSWIVGLGVQPLFQPIGGTVRYRAGRWSVSVIPSPVLVDAATLPITAPRSASSPAVRLQDIDPSVAVGDLAYVQVGAGYTIATQPF